MEFLVKIPALVARFRDVKMKKITTTLFLLPLWVHAELNILDDNELAAVDGEGVNFVLEDYVYDASEAAVTIKEISGTEKIEIEDLYVMGAGSNQGADKTPITLGLLENPFNLNITDIQGGSNSGLVFSFPGDQDRQGADLGIRTRFKVVGNSRVPNGSLDVLNVSATDASLHGSNFRLWGDGTETLGDMRIRLRIDEIIIRSASCSGLSTNCSADSTLVKPYSISGIGTDLQLGFGDVFPVNFSVTTNGHFRIKATGLNSSNYQAYYDSSVAKSFIYIDNITLQATSRFPTSVNLGQSYISGIRLQYLDVQSHDL